MTTTIFARLVLPTINDWIKTMPVTNRRNAVPNSARAPTGAARFTLVYISAPPSILRSKALCHLKTEAKKFGPWGLSLAHPANQRFHVIEIALERATSRSRQAVLRLWG